MFNMFDNLIPLWLRVVIALADYLIKAADQWRETEVGAKEWSDFTSVYEQMLNGGDSNVSFSVEDRVENVSPSGNANVQHDSAQPARRRSGGVVIQNDK